MLAVRTGALQKAVNDEGFVDKVFLESLLGEEHLVTSLLELIEMSLRVSLYGWTGAFEDVENVLVAFTYYPRLAGAADETIKTPLVHIGRSGLMYRGNKRMNTQKVDNEEKTTGESHGIKSLNS